MIARRFAAVVLGAGFSLSLAAPAMAEIAYVDGGKWNYGVNSASVWSYYDHASKSHKSTAKGKIMYYSGCTSKGVTARASGPKAFINNQSYYGFC